MNAPIKTIIATFVAALVMAGPADAHTRSESHSSWQISGSTVHLQFSVPDLEAKRLPTSGGSMPTSEELGRYIAVHVAAYSGETVCPMKEGPKTLATATGYSRFEFIFECISDKDIRIENSAWFELVASHTNFAQIQDSQGRFIEQLITKDRQSLSVTEGAESPLQDASFFTFIGMGIMHIFTGYDHQAFLLGLVLLSRRLRDLLFVITGFTIGHSLTLSLATLGVIRPHAEFIDALVGLTIALIAAENVANNSGRPATIAGIIGGGLLLMAVASSFGIGALPPLLLIGSAIFAANYLLLATHVSDAGKLRLVVTMMFGLIHGFSFAANLFEMRLPQGRLAELLFGFNVGVELGQLSVVAAIIAIGFTLTKLRLVLPRPLVADIGGSAVFGTGLFWLVLRGYG